MACWYCRAVNFWSVRRLRFRSLGFREPGSMVRVARARIVMQGAGPAIRLIGGHRGTADPGSFQDGMLNNERMPTVRNLEIIGAHKEADGLELVGTMQAVVSGVALRGLRHGVHLTRRNRNVIISDCQIYHNRGVGIYLDAVNLHQINIHGNHVSYNRLGGIRVERSEIRNLQIVGNDIEYNNDRSHKLGDQPTAEIYVDATAEKASVNEVTVCGNTIQATPSPGGANIRILDDGQENRPPGLWTITGNVIGSQTNNIHLTGCRSVSITGNSLYSCTERNLLVEDSSQIVFSGNHSRRHAPHYLCGWRIVNSSDCLISASSIHDDTETGQASDASLLEISDCERINVTGCQLLGGVPHGIAVQDSSFICVNATQVIDPREQTQMRSAIRFSGTGENNLVTGCTLGRGADGDVQAEGDSVTLGENIGS